jgi:hypothetical protein
LLSTVPGRPVDEIPFLEFGRQYHDQCAQFNNLVLTGPVVNGERTPANDHERKLMVQNNRAVFQALLVTVRDLGGSAFDLNRAVTRVGKRSAHA